MNVLQLTLLITIFLEMNALIIQKETDLKIYILVILINMYTNPLMNYFLTFIPTTFYSLMLFIFEFIVIVIEAFLINIQKKNLIISLKISIINNSMSWLYPYINSLLA